MHKARTLLLEVTGGFFLTARLVMFLLKEDVVCVAHACAFRVGFWCAAFRTFLGSICIPFVWRMWQMRGDCLECHDDFLVASQTSQLKDGHSCGTSVVRQYSPLVVERGFLRTFCFH